MSARRRPPENMTGDMRGIRALGTDLSHTVFPVRGCRSGCIVADICSQPTGFAGGLPRGLAMPFFAAFSLHFAANPTAPVGSSLRPFPN